ncbi:pyrroline-5-carboxylate reductase [Tumebacillus algifaecis]|uniref:Pyrroline-5-carboxylate reductase n=1 Tax=Tumebacillus algifaecis TaxID=1214604 RepID=A0A223CYK0_9BACL|nr:pyrroline-5-carboxylate reductase [Tumebacillus algifaecis]ASS74325.1 pyrroline-5-carboxylate reductase [Tumebacillus algifaecis]
MKKQTILFLGAGRMAEAILSGLLTRKRENIEEIIVTNRSNQERLAELRDKYGVTATNDWRAQVEKADTIVLAMKPGQVRESLIELGPLVNGQFVFTVAAGIGTGMMEQHLPAGTPVAWVMPNTAASLGASVSLYTYGQAVKAEHKAVLEMILDGIGIYEECTEEQIHQLTAVTGSAPAFLYRFAEVLEETAREFGVSEEQARRMIVGMFYGSALMLQQGQSPAILRDGVTTPGGATAAGLRVMEEREFPALLKSAVEATNARAKEMAKE